MDLKDEKNKTDKKDYDKKFNAQKFLTKNIDKAKEKNINQNNKISSNNINHNLNKFINASKNPTKSNNESNLQKIKEMKTIEFKNKIKLKLEPEKESKEMNININNFNKQNNTDLIKNIPDNSFDKKATSPVNINNKEKNHLVKYINSSKKEKEKENPEIYINNNDNNIFNNHKYLYINSTKEKNVNKINLFKEINNDDTTSNKNNNIKKFESFNIKKSNINSANELNKLKNDYNINKEDKSTTNNFFVNSLDERIEKIRETLNSINVMDILADQAGFQSYKKEEFKDDDFYNKAKMLNKEFYDNLDVKFFEIENILKDLEEK